MKFKILFLLTLLALPLAFNLQPSAFAADFYSAKEFSLDLGAQYDINRTDASLLHTSLEHGDFAYSLGMNYYLTDYAGIGTDFYALLPGAHQDASAGPGSKSLIKAANLSGLLRYPIGRFAPYARAGFGRDWHAGEYTWHAGPGLELRIHNGIGLFTEARYTWINHERDELQFRVGFRVARWPGSKASFPPDN